MFRPVNYNPRFFVTLTGLVVTSTSRLDTILGMLTRNQRRYHQGYGFGDEGASLDFFCSNRGVAFRLAESLREAKRSARIRGRVEVYDMVEDGRKICLKESAMATKTVKKVAVPKTKRASKRYEVVLEVEGYDNERDDRILSSLTPSQQRFHTGAGFGFGRRDLCFNCGKKETAARLKSALLVAAKKAKAIRPTVSISTVDRD